MTALEIKNILADNGFEIDTTSSMSSFSNYIRVKFDGYSLKVRVSDHNNPRGSYADADIRFTDTYEMAIEKLRKARYEFRDIK